MSCPLGASSNCGEKIREREHADERLNAEMVSLVFMA